MDKNEKNNFFNQKSLKKSKKSDFFKPKSKKSIIKALTKKAIGYDSQEIIEEFSLDDNMEEKLIKKKITTKNIPPDVSAVKVLLELENDNSTGNLKNLTDEELDKKIDEILIKIKEMKDDNHN